MNNLLEVKNLSVSFGSEKKQLEVVSGISFTVRRGEILALVGESGCGKSASCLALTGLLPSPPAVSWADKILFQSSSGTFDLANASSRQLRKVRGGHIAYVFQEPTASLNPVMRIGAQIAEVLKLHRPEVKDIKAETVSLLSQVGITSPADRIKSYPHELSGGMQQRLNIARALAYGGDILLVDEPMKGMDPDTAKAVAKLIKDSAKNKTLILVTHDEEEAKFFADKIYRYENKAFR